MSPTAYGQPSSPVEKRYLLVDKSKFGRTGLYRLSARGGFDAIFSG